MKTRVWILALLSILVAGALMVPIAGAKKKAKHQKFGGGREESPLVIGHRGASGFLPEHTLAEIKTLGAKQTRTPRPTRFDGKFKIPTFQEVIDLAKRESKKRGRTIGIYPETKHPTFHQTLKPVALPLEGRLVNALKRN